MTARPALGRLPSVLRIVLAGLAGALLVALLGQISSRHTVDIGRYDAAYVQGFYEAEHSSDSAGPGAYLDGADGAVRWSYPAGSALLFPQVGLPGTLHLRLRAWRPDGNLPRITLLLNGGEVLADVQASGDWQDLSVELRSGMAKPIDFFVELRVSSSLTLADDRSVGVLLDALTYEVTGLPVLPYPAQLFYAALVGAMLWLLLGEGQSRGFWPPVVGLGLYGIAWLLLYHCQPPLYPYPLRMLPPLVCLGLAALLLLRDGPGLVSRAPALLCRLAPLALISGWAAATLLAAQSHVTLARPGVENDFRVFATRETLDQVLGADSFYNLGYPLLLWLVRPLFAGNAFLAGRLVAVLCGALFLAGGYWLARAMLPPGPALLALLLLALSGFVAQYGLYLGSDMPLAACVSLCVAAFVAGGRQPPAPSPLTPRLFLLAGVFGGLAFLMRHLGLVLLPWGLLVLLLRGRAGHRPALLFAAGFLLMAAPQLLINLAQTGSPLYNQQAKNVWLAVYANTDWGRWGEVPNSISLAEIVLRDPARFLANWWHNVVAFLGSGAEDTSEFGRADQLRLLGWPANWLAVGGLGWWAVRSAGGRDRARLPSPAALLLLILIYALAVSMAFTLQRFFLPLTPIYATAAAWLVWRLGTDARHLLGVGLALVVVLWGGWFAGVGYALNLQPADEVAAVRMVEATLPPGARLGAWVSPRLPLAKYSAIAHRVVGWAAVGDSTHLPSAADLAALYAAGAEYLLWDAAAGQPPLTDPTGALAGDSGRYRLYRLGP